MISNNRGSALIIVYMIIAVLTILGTGIMSRELSEISNTRRYSDAVKAFWYAEAGIYKEVYELNYPTADVGWPGSGEVRDVAVTNISASAKMINVTGYFGNSSATISVLAAKSGSPFNFAAFGNTSLSMSGQGNVSSYNSTSDPTGTVRLSNGDIGTNGDITMSGQAFVYGDATTGADGEFEDEDHDYISGDVSHSSELYLTDVSVPADLANVTLGNSVSSSWSPRCGELPDPVDIFGRAEHHHPDRADEPVFDEHRHGAGSFRPGGDRHLQFEHGPGHDIHAGGHIPGRAGYYQ